MVVDFGSGFVECCCEMFIMVIGGVEDGNDVDFGE